MIIIIIIITAVFSNNKTKNVLIKETAVRDFSHLSAPLLEALIETETN